VEVLTWLGDWEPAELMLHELIDRGYERERAWPAEGMLAAFRGDLDHASTQLREERERISRSSSPDFAVGWYHLALWGVDLLVARGEIDQALELSEELVTAMAEVDADLQLATVARAALESLAAARESRLPVPERLAGA